MHLKFGVLAIILASPVNAGIIVFEQPPAQPPLVDESQIGRISDLDPAIPGQPGVEAADNFTLTVATVIHDVHWWGHYGGTGPVPDNFRIRILNDVGGRPGETPFIDVAPVNFMRTPTDMVDPFLGTIFQYWADLPSEVPLAAGTTYYLSVVNNTSGSEADWGWLGSTAPNPTQPWIRFDGDMWIQGGGPPTNFAFQLTTIPEPSTIIFATVLLGFISCARRRYTPI